MFSRVEFYRSRDICGEIWWWGDLVLIMFGFESGFIFKILSFKSWFCLGFFVGIRELNVVFCVFNIFKIICFYVFLLNLVF